MRFRVHYTWIFVFALITAIVTTQFSEIYPLLQRLMLGVIVSVLFLAAVTIRELILSVTTFYREIPIKKITLFAFGGVYEVSRERIVSTHLPLLYLAKFLSNLIISTIFYGLYAIFVNTGHPTLAGLTQWLTYIYFLNFLLHFIPAFPLDGGEILRVVLWRSTGNYYKATQVTTLIGLAAGLFLIFGGVLVFIITQQWMISLLIILIGWIIQIAAGTARRQVKIYMVLQNIKAEDIMTGEYPEISGQVNIRQLFREHILIKGWNYAIVVDGRNLKGILTVKQIKSIPAKRWNNTTVGDIMTPSDRLGTARLQETADILYEKMTGRGIDYIPVLKDDKIAGVVSRSALMSLVKIRSEFGADSI